MKKIADNFCGYLNVKDDTYAYNVSNNIVTLLPAKSEKRKIYESFNLIQSYDTDFPEYFFGEDCDGQVAILRNGKFSINSIGFSPTIKFATPLIIKASGNAEGFYGMMTESWDKFHAITFYGGNINAVCNPQLAVESLDANDCLKNEGAREIRIRPWSDYTRSIDFEIDGEKINLTISVLQSGERNNVEHMGSYSLGELDSFIRLSFENAQGFEKIGEYYIIIKKLISILTLQNNIFFEVYLSQRTVDNKFFKTAICKIFDNYENYSMKKSHNVISIYRIFDNMPNLIMALKDNEADSLIGILPEDNRKLGKISVMNIQDLCTALEVAYQRNKRIRQKDKLIEDLKKIIKKAIAEFSEKHTEIDVNKETTISSAFQYLDYTLKQRILTLYDENCNIIDAVVSKWSLPQINEINVHSFVNLRNNKTHSGIVEWSDSVNIYTALFALGYTCLFKYIGVPDDIIKSTILQVF